MFISFAQNQKPKLNVSAIIKRQLSEYLFYNIDNIKYVFDKLKLSG